MTPLPPMYPHRPRVLVVEDEPRLRDLLCEVIPEMGFDVIAARSAEDAHHLMQSDPRDILLLDLHLPGRGGMQWFQEVRRIWPRSQVIILTGHGDLDAARQAIRLDVADFLTKPCRLHEVEQALDRALRRWQAAAPHRAPPPPPATAPPPAPQSETLAQSERRRILQALRRNDGNRTATARELGISRRTLHYRLRQYGIPPGVTPDAP